MLVFEKRHVVVVLRVVIAICCKYVVIIDVVTYFRKHKIDAEHNAMHSNDRCSS